jgi:glycyl-tRNA synthetase beta chain
VLTGKIEDQFMDVPAEILQTSMRTHQKYFSTKDSTGKLANRFIVVANMVAQDGGKEIIAGNERVLRARLSDAKFFWDQDRQTKLADRVNALKGIVFHAKLGTQYERVERIEALAGEIAEKIGADVAKAKRAARLCKADLTSGVVGEFPELQGVMGRYYALHDGEDAEVADAVRDHYKPLGPSDAVPTSLVSVAVALADKLDQLICFLAARERPTGSGDPYALRRAALGMIRIVLGTEARVPINALALEVYRVLLDVWGRNYLARYRMTDGESIPGAFTDFHPNEKYSGVDAVWARAIRGDLVLADPATIGGADWIFDPLLTPEKLCEEVILFLADRLKVALREKGTRHDLIDAIFSLGGEDDIVRLVARVEALQTFLKSDDGANLLTAYKRSANILKAEEKKDKAIYSGDPDPEAFVLPEEKALFVELATASELIRAEVGRERFVEAMGVMARLRKPVDAFFDKVTVNDKDPALRKNRLLLLSRLRATLHLVADFSKIEG